MNFFWSLWYDKVMIFFVVCLKEFVEFVNVKDKEVNILFEKCFKFLYKLVICIYYLFLFDLNFFIFKEIIIKVKVLNFV